MNFLSAPLAKIEKNVQAEAHINAAQYWRDVIKAEMKLITRFHPDDGDAYDAYMAPDASHFALAYDPDDNVWVRILWVDHRTRECFRVNAYSLVDGGDDVPECESFSLDGSGYEANVYAALKNI